MLLDTKIRIETTNDGNENTTKVTASLDSKFIDVMVSMELAKGCMEKALKNKVERINHERGRKMSDTNFNRLIQSITLREIYEGTDESETFTSRRNNES